MGRDALLDAGGAGGTTDGALRGRLVQVVAAELARAGVEGELSGGEEPLPGPCAGCRAELAVERVGERSAAVAGSEVAAVECAERMQMSLERRLERGGQSGQAIASALALAHAELVTAPVEILHTQPQALDEPQADAVERRRDQAVAAFHRGEHCTHLLDAEHDRRRSG